MIKVEANNVSGVKIGKNKNQDGSALIIAVFVLVLISAFVALALFRTSSEAAAIGNEKAESQTTYAAQGSLEMMTRNFNKLFEIKLNPSDDDRIKIENALVPGLSGDYSFNQEVKQTSTSSAVVLPGGPFAGLYAIRDNWRLRTTATQANSDVQVQLTRDILNNRIPIFQFGIFYEDDLELFRPPRFGFGGRVHSNRHFFISPGTEGVYFDSRVTAAGHIITQTWRNGYTGDSGNDQTFIKNASGVNKQLLPSKGSVLNTTSGATNNIFSSDTDMPPSKINPNWASDSAIFDGNLKSEVPVLKLPLKVGKDRDLIEMVKRGKEVASSTGGDLFKNTAGNLAPVDAANEDDSITRAERFANKTGIRISLADSKAKLPGCASGVGTNAVSTACGIRLDGSTAGYQPKAMKKTSTSAFDYIPTRVNGYRLRGISTQQVWIKVETVQTNTATNAIVTKDITEDFLSMGVTEQAPHIQSGSTTRFRIPSTSGYDDTPPSNGTAASPSTNLTATTAQSASQGTDSRSVIKLQRFVIQGPEIPKFTDTTTDYLTYDLTSDYNVVIKQCEPVVPPATTTCVTNAVPNSDPENTAHLKVATVNGKANRGVVPFPIKMFDTREGEFYDWNNRVINRSDKGKVTKMGTMSLVDIDIANLRRFFRGDFNGLFPTDTQFAISKGGVGLTNLDIPSAGGWVLYLSDRRGDYDFDGEFDMEDIYGYDYDSSQSIYEGTDGVLQKGEDVNGNGVLDVDFVNEAPDKYDDDQAADFAAVKDHKFYRRGFRLINGTVLPGIYDSLNASNTRGFTVSSENGLYIQGNYNATGVTSVPSTGNTPYNNYKPFDSPTHIPASVVADSVTILSNNWNDARSFQSPYDEGGRLASDTNMRFALISGDTIASLSASPHQGGLSPRLNGGVHNFKRFLERWTGDNLNFCGSLINLYNSRNNNGSFKCCDTVYDPPNRNWVFDSTFLDPSRLPPGTPFFQYVQTTGFQRTNN